MIDCNKLSNKERDLLQYIDVPRKFNGLFVNDMRIGVPFQGKGIESKVIEKMLVEKNIYALDPVEDGQHFWKKFSFEYNRNG